MSLNLETLRHALQVAGSRGMTRVRLRSGQEEFRAVISETAPAEEQPVETEPETQSKNGRPGPATSQILASVVGFVSEGEVDWKPGVAVEEGQLLAEVQALGIANEVRADTSGKVLEWHAEPGDPVEFGQAIVTIGEDS